MITTVLYGDLSVGHYLSYHICFILLMYLQVHIYLYFEPTNLLNSENLSRKIRYALGKKVLFQILALKFM